jgi:hypothetical protein
MTEKLFKCLKKDRIAPYSGAQWQPIGTWMPEAEKLVECCTGYHLCREQDLREWVREEIYLVEYAGERIDCNNKTVVQQARLTQKIENWNKDIMIQWASDCAEHVLHIFEKKYPDDDRPRKAIEVVRNYAADDAADDAGAAYYAAATAAAAANAAYYAAYADAAYYAAATATATVAAAAADAADAAYAAYYAAAAAAAAANTAYAAYADAAYYAAAAAAAYDDANIANVAYAAYADVSKQKEIQWQTQHLLHYLFPNEAH